MISLPWTHCQTRCKEPGKRYKNSFETCHRIGFCEQGLFQYDTQCKQPCEKNKQRLLTTRLMICNLEDAFCKHSQDTDMSDVKCYQLTCKITFGGCSTSSTALNPNAQRGTGFRAPVVSKSDLKCRKYDDDHSLATIATKEPQNFDFEDFYWDSPVSSVK